MPCAGVTVADNIVNSGSRGIELQEGANNTITKNTTNNNARSGLVLAGSNGNTVRDNNVGYNGQPGVVLSQNTSTGNTVRRTPSITTT